MSRTDNKETSEVTNPNKNKEQNEIKANKSNTNPVTEVITIVESEGPGSLFSGLLPRACRALASGGIQFASYELTQNALLNR
jgi:hypothetical protein